MKRLVATLVVALALPFSAHADNVGGCGFGSKLFDGQRGVAPQVLAVTTNGSTGSQTFGISSGTVGCTQDGVVKSSWKTAAYIDGNMNRLALDASRGSGESLVGLASVVGIEAQDVGHFERVVQTNFATIFPGPSASSPEVIAALRSVMLSDSVLNRYAANV